MTTNELAARLEQCGIPFDAALPEKLLRYHALLMDWNTRMDLTAVTDEDEMIDRHYVDSLMALKQPGLIPETGRLIDVGTGAGFPGMPLALACPDLQVTLMDAQQKRLTFLQA
ncbi:MAG: class I SAM-dependent methyltransferase, partial [Clostridia bacterium]|nr:class I SAM-dependent methyltransferase [Clostridia bacterium]